MNQKGWLDQSKVEGGVESGSMMWGVNGDGECRELCPSCYHMR